MMTHAAPVLALAAGLRSGRVRMPLAHFHRQAIQTIGEFDRAVQAAYPDDTARRARYALCITIDDVAQNLPGLGGDGAEWAKRSLVAHFFQTTIGGERFWQFVDDAVRAPEAHRDLIELYHACLAAGFEDRFRAMPDGKRQLGEVMAQLLAALPQGGERSMTEMSPHWRGERVPVARFGVPTRVAVAAAATAVLLLAAYIVFRLMLASSAGAPSAAVAAINPDGPLRLSRGGASIEPPPPSAAATALRAALAADIAQGKVSIDEDATTTRIRTVAGPLFDAGSDQLAAGRADLFARIGKAVAAVPGAITVEDHVGTGAGASLAFPDAAALTTARADKVAVIVKAQPGNAARVAGKGLGDTVPLAPNATPEGKARNDRVEVVMPRAS